MVDIGVEFMGLKFKTPFIVASGPAVIQSGRIRHCVDAMAENHWSGYVTKSIISKVHVQQRPYLWTARDYQFKGMQNMGPRMEQYSRDLLRTLKDDFRISHEAGVLAIPSIVGYSMEEWSEMAKSMEDIGADAVEVNLGCPVEEKTIKGSMGGYGVLQDEGKTYEIVNVVSESCSIPVMAKLSFHAKEIGSIARICKEAGAEAVSAINTIRGIVGIDIETGNLLSSDASGNGYITGLSGPIIRPFGLKSVIEIGLTTDIPVCGIGGIDGWKSVIEYIMAGAGLVQICTAVLWYGFRLGRRIRDGLVRFMKEKDYSTIEDFRGISLGRTVVEPVDHPWVKALIDYDRCNFCQRCYHACRDVAFGAVEIEDSRVVIRQELCEGCGLCRVVCKKDAIRYVSR